MKKYIATITGIVISLIFTACEDTTSNLGIHDDEHTGYETFIEHVEHHFEDSESPIIIPTSTKENAPDISEEHTCFTVTPSAAEGWLSYTVELEGDETKTDRSLFIDATGITAEIFDENETEIHGHEADLDEVTTEYIKSGFIFHELSAGTYAIRLEGLTVDSQVKLVMAHGGDDADSHEEYDSHNN